MKAAAPHETEVGTKQENKSQWPRYILHDRTLEAFMRRMDDHQELVVQRGGIPTNDARRALVSRSPESKQAVARWLSSELKKLRDGERRIGAAPVLRGVALSRLIIADLAMTMVENLAEDIGEDLVCLLQELLDVDRHRRARADTRSEQFVAAVQITAQAALTGRTIGVNQLAKQLSVSPSTVVAWRRSTNFSESVERSKRMWAYGLRKYYSQIKHSHPDVPDQEAFRHAFKMFAQDSQSEETND